MRDPGNILVAIFVSLAMLLVAGVVTVTGVWCWQNAQDKRNCRTHGGTVLDVGDHAEWHCVGVTPEAK